MTTGIGHWRAAAAHLEAVDARQHEVEHDEVGRLVRHPAQRLVAVVHALDRVAVAHQVAPDDIRHRGVVVYHDDPPRRIAGCLAKGFPFRN